MSKRDTNDGRLPRIMIFPDRPDCLVVYLPEGISLHMPTLHAPFDKEGVAVAFADAGVNVRISEGTPGQWNAAYSWLHKNERAERGQRMRLMQAVANQKRLDMGGIAGSRAKVIDEKNQIDEEIRNLKVRLNEAKARAATHGEYMPVNIYRSMESELQQLKDKSQAMQTRIGELRDQERAERDAEHRIYAERFMHAAYGVLPEEWLQRVHGAAQVVCEDAEVGE